MKRSAIAAAILLALWPGLASATTYTVTQGMQPTQYGFLSSSGGSYASWETARGGNGPSVTNGFSYAQAGVTCVGGNYVVRRGEARFDLNSIPASATIVGVSFAAWNLQSPPSAIVVQRSSRTSQDTSVSVSDWSAATGSVLGSGTILGTIGGPLTQVALDPSAFTGSSSVWLFLTQIADYTDTAPGVTQLNTLYSPCLYVTYTLPVNSTVSYSIEPTVTISGPISIDGTVPVSFDTTALARAIAAALPTPTPGGTTTIGTTGTVPVSLQGLGSWGPDALDAGGTVVLVTIGIGAAMMVYGRRAA